MILLAAIVADSFFPLVQNKINRDVTIDSVIIRFARSGFIFSYFRMYFEKRRKKRCENKRWNYKYNWRLSLVFLATCWVKEFEFYCNMERVFTDELSIIGINWTNFSLPLSWDVLAYLCLVIYWLSLGAFYCNIYVLSVHVSIFG